MNLEEMASWPILGQCPHCNTAHIQGRGLAKRLSLGIFSLFFSPKRKYQFECMACEAPVTEAALIKQGLSQESLRKQFSLFRFQDYFFGFILIASIFVGLKLNFVQEMAKEQSWAMNPKHNDLYVYRYRPKEKSEQLRFICLKVFKIEKGNEKIFVIGPSFERKFDALKFIHNEDHLDPIFFNQEYEIYEEDLREFAEDINLEGIYRHSD